MAIAIGTGVFLVFIGRLVYHRVYRWQQERGRLRSKDPDNFGVFLLTTGVAIGVWFALDAALQWQTPFHWRVAAILTGLLVADGVLAGLRRG